jgi:hypothetical protein
VALPLAAAALGCKSAPREPFLTYFNGDHGISIRYPSSWRTEQAVQEGVWYRYFLAPPAGPQRKPAVSVTLLVGALGGTVDDYAQSYLTGNQVVRTRDEGRGAATGKSFLFRSNDGATRHSLLLLKEGERVYGLYGQGDAALFEQHFLVLEEMARSLTLERASDYPEQRNDRFGFAVRIPPSWRETRKFTGGGTLQLYYRSPPLAIDRDPLDAALTLTVEPIPGKGGIQEYYDSTRTKLGESFQLLSHNKWRGGFADVMRTETAVSVSRVKRFYRAADGRGYSMTFEARDDVFSRASRWCDLIADTLLVGEELKAP